MKRVTEFPGSRAERHATALAHNAPDCRVVLFTLAPGQTVPVHTSTSTVVATVAQGNGVFTGADSQVELAPGASVIYEPNEPHGMTAGPHGMRFVAVIAPAPA